MNERETTGALAVPMKEALDCIQIGGEITVEDITSMVSISARREAKRELDTLEAELNGLRETFATRKEAFMASCQGLAETIYLAGLKKTAVDLGAMFPGVEAKVTCCDDLDDKAMTLSVSLLVGIPGTNDRYYSSKLPEGYAFGLFRTVQMPLADGQRSLFAALRETMEELKALGKKIDEVRRFLHEGIQMVEEQFRVNLLGMKLERAGDSGKVIAAMAANFIKSDSIQDLLPDCLKSKVEVRALSSSQS